MKKTLKKIMIGFISVMGAAIIILSAVVYQIYDSERIKDPETRILVDVKHRVDECIANKEYSEALYMIESYPVLEEVMKEDILKMKMYNVTTIKEADEMEKKELELLMNTETQNN